MRPRRSALFLAGAIAAAGLGPAHAQGVTSVRGRVVDCDAALYLHGARATGLAATITLTEDGGGTRTFVTGADGRFTFLTASDGAAHIDVEAARHVGRLIAFDTRGSDSLALNVFLMREYEIVSRIPAKFVQACDDASLPRPDPDTVDRYTLRS